MSMSNYPFAIRVAQAMKNTHFSHHFPRKSTSGFVFQMFISNFPNLELSFKAQKFDISSVDCIMKRNYQEEDQTSNPMLFSP